MNDASNLRCYTKLIRFQMSPSEEELLFESPDTVQQRTIQSWAHAMGLEFEYSLATRIARVVRQAPTVATESAGMFDGEPTSSISFLNSQYAQPLDYNFDGVFNQDQFLLPDLVAITSQPTTSHTKKGSYETSDKSTQTDMYPLHHPTHPHLPIQPVSTYPPAATILPPVSNSNNTYTPQGHRVKSMRAILACQPCRSIKLAKPLPSIATTEQRSRVSAVVLERENAALSTPSVSLVLGRVLIAASKIKIRKSKIQINNEGFNAPSLKHGTPTQMHEPTGPPLIPRQESSQIGPPMSVEGERGRELVKRAYESHSILNSPASSGYQEIIFDSSSPRMRSPASASSGRRGPLDAAARAAANAVKAIGSCWRCKFLRKNCDVDSPCWACPKTSRKSGNWSAVGCKRGSLKEEMPSLELCPGPDALATKLGRHSAKQFWAAANEWSRDQIGQRENIIKHVLDVTASHSDQDFLNVFLQNLDIHLPPAESPRNPIHEKSPDLPPTLSPLQECIAAIVYESNSSSGLNSMTSYLHNSLLKEIVMFQAAARYQANTDSDELIAQSFICLRSSLEASRVLFEHGKYLHQACSSSTCEIECIENMTRHLEQYLNELSRVFFKSENMRTKHNWWLSAFYSFCIQSFVRQSLMEMSILLRGRIGRAADEYLHLAIRLFIASSGDYDPLVRGFAPGSKEKDFDHTLVADFQAAQVAVSQTSWKGDGITSSGQYLKKLFGDTGQDLLPGPATLLKEKSRIASFVEDSENAY
ncbi:hypothetical protein G7Y89_g11252 [Cudoniella acicularis]|uniref:Uncharacterized protein n=1 Tax=Cudoniella acicularis TaxID=354080 RepID=A0A8H4RDK2_9HELO|nr:hypothetical protein G7Y89_g11252 [Cudoniella acicularis]